MAASGGGGGAASEAIGAAAGAGSLLPVIFGRGQNTRTAQGFGPESPGYDPGAGYFGGARGEAAKYASTMLSRGQAADERKANLANFDQANMDRARGLLARGGQADMANAMRARALGQVPSIAQMQADRQMGQAVAAQGAQQASARGAAGLALAGQTAAGNIAGAQSAISNQAQINAAAERERAEGAASQAYTGMRGGDLASQGQAAQQAQFQAGMQQANRDANDVRSMSYDKLGHEAKMGEMAARVQQQATMANSYNTANAANQQTGNQNAQSKGVLQTILEFPKVLSDERAKVPMLLSGMSPASAAAAPSFDALTSNGGMDPMASLKKHSDFATQYQSNPGAAPMMSDERSKTPMLSRGKRGINPGDYRAPPGVAPRAAFTPSRGWEVMSQSESDAYNEWRGNAPDDHKTRADWKAGEDEALAQQRARSDRDAENDDIDRQVAERRAQDARERTDPAVGLERISRDRGMLRRGGTQAEADEDGRAPGTADFERTEPKDDPGPGKRPWWTQLGEAGKAMAEAQFGRPHMVSDDRAKLSAAFQAGAESQLSPDEKRDTRTPEQAAKAAKDRAIAAIEASQAKPSGVAHPSLYSMPQSADSTSAPRSAGGFAGAQTKASAPASNGRQSSPEDLLFSGMKGVAAGAKSDRGFEDQLFSGMKGAASATDDPVAGANRAMAGSAYAYKPGLTPPEQRPGEPNFGPMAQEMEKNPITATAVKTDPATGLKVIDKDKALKVTMAGVADLQKQNDEMRRVLLAKGGRR